MYMADPRRCQIHFRRTSRGPHDAKSPGSHLVRFHLRTMCIVEKSSQLTYLRIQLENDRRDEGYDKQCERERAQLDSWDNRLQCDYANCLVQSEISGAIYIYGAFGQMGQKCTRVNYSIEPNTGDGRRLTELNPEWNIVITISYSEFISLEIYIRRVGGDNKLKLFFFLISSESNQKVKEDLNQL